VDVVARHLLLAVRHDGSDVVELVDADAGWVDPLGLGRRADDDSSDADRDGGHGDGDPAVPGVHHVLLSVRLGHHRRAAGVPVDGR